MILLSQLQPLYLSPRPRKWVYLRNEFQSRRPDTLETLGMSQSISNNRLTPS